MIWRNKPNNANNAKPLNFTQNEYIKNIRNDIKDF